MTEKLIIDCDPGVDDALAIIYAFGQNKYTDITILTVAGNVGVNQTTANALRLMALLQNDDKAETIRGKKVRVIKGCATSMDGERPSAASVHGRDGMGEVPLRLIHKKGTIGAAIDQLKRVKKNIFANDTTAVDFLTALLSCTEGDYDLVCTGPLTNIATALHILGPERHEGFWNIFNQVVVMGGAVRVPGNVTPFAEFNFFADPIAARIVFESWEKSVNTQNDHLKNLYLIPLDATERVALRWEEIKSDEYVSNVHCFVTCMLQKYFFFHGVQANPVYWEHEDEDLEKQFWGSKAKKGDRVPNELVEEYRKNIAKFYKEKKIGGSSGVKQLPRFCYLHDPLAMYINFNLATLQDLFRKERIRILKDLGEARGMSVAVTTRPRPIEALIDGNTAVHAEGTSVQILCPDVFINGGIDISFKDALKKAIYSGTD